LGYSSSRELPRGPAATSRHCQDSAGNTSLVPLPVSSYPTGKARWDTRGRPQRSTVCHPRHALPPSPSLAVLTVPVRVSLTVENPSFSRDFPQREIWLSVDDNKARIGRTSKVEAKGCLAAENNGWFDSPVMSRDHAEITADLHTRVRSNDRDQHAAVLTNWVFRRCTLPTLVRCTGPSSTAANSAWRITNPISSGTATRCASVCRSTVAPIRFLLRLSRSASIILSGKLAQPGRRGCRRH